MTISKPANRVGLVDSVARLTAELSAARADVALFARLTAAEANATRLADELALATEKLAISVEDKIAADQASAFATIKSVAVIDKFPDEHVLRATFSIDVTRKSYDSMSMDNVVSTKTYPGFQALPDDVLGFIFTKQPSAIPAKIMALAPDDPEVAIGRYFVSQRRGFVMPVEAA